MAREEKVMIRLGEKMKFQFQMYADRYGLTMSALGAFVIGQWIDGQNRINQVNSYVVDQTVSAVKAKIDEPLTDATFQQLHLDAPDFVDMFKRIAEDVMKPKDEAKA